jgi:N-acetylglucosaminyl-diphospho-decaprenol L-rhamnosyltransferase
VHHVGFGSHKIENANKSELSRNWHFCWSSLYFRQKYYSKKEFRKYFVKMIFKYFMKTLVNILLMRSVKFKKNFVRLKACLNYLTIKKSNFRV